VFVSLLNLDISKSDNFGFVLSFLFCFKNKTMKAIYFDC